MGMDTFTEITKTLETPFWVRVFSDMTSETTGILSNPDCTMTLEQAVKACQIVVAKILTFVSDEPTCMDIGAYMAGMMDGWVAKGFTETDLWLVQAHVYAAFGYSGLEEW